MNDLRLRPGVRWRTMSVTIRIFAADSFDITLCKTMPVWFLSNICCFLSATAGPLKLVLIEHWQEMTNDAEGN